MPILKSIAFYVTLVAFAIALVWLGYVMYEGLAVTENLFRRRVADLLLQLALVVIIGAVVKLLIDWGAKINSRFRSRREQKIDFLRRVRDVSVNVNYAQDLMNAHNSGKTYGKSLRDIILLRGEIVEIVEDLKTTSGLFAEQNTIEQALLDINRYLDRGRNEYIRCHDDVGADASNSKKIQYSIERLKMKWIKDFMASGEDYTKEFYNELTKCKGRMRSQVYGTQKTQH